MNLRANPERNFLLKYLAIGIACCAFAVYAGYDGFLAYPAELPRANAWKSLQDEKNADPSIEQTDLVARWKAIAKKNGWSAKQIRKDDTAAAIQSKIYWQYVFIVVGLTIGTPCVWWYFVNRNSWIESTEDGLRSSNGNELVLTQIFKFDKKKWEKKGIAVVHFKSHNGDVERTFILDDLKYDRKTTDEIVRWIESRIPPEMIVNGKPENTQAKPHKEGQAGKLDA